LLLLLRDHWLNRYIPRLLAIAATLATGWMPLIRSNHWGETFTLTVLAYGGSAQPQSATSGIPGADIAFFISCLCLVVYLPLILASLGSFPLLHSPHRTAIALVQTLLLLGFAFYGPFLWLSAQWDYLHMEVINFSLTDESGQKGLHGWLLVATLLFILAVAVSCYAAVKLRYRWRSIPIALGVFLALGMVIGSVGMYDMFRAEMWRMHFPDPAVLDSISRLRILPVFAPVQLFLSSWIPTVSAIDMSGSHRATSYLVTNNFNLAQYVLLLYLAAVPLWWYTAHSMLNAARHPQH
jgi:glucan phosphoethanolaminetransferase (alkaline phosphatase superfamily)